MSILDRFKKPDKAGPQRGAGGDQAGEPGCSVCGTTRSQVMARIEAKGLRALGFYFGLCPTCRKGFCRDHMVRGDKHDFTDFDKCPDDGTRLKVFGPHDPITEPTDDVGNALKRASDALGLGASGDPMAVDALLKSVRENAGQGDGRHAFVPPSLEALALLLDRSAERVSDETLAALAKLHEEKFYSPVFYEELPLPKLLSTKEQNLPIVVERAQGELDRRASS